MLCRSYVCDNLLRHCCRGFSSRVKALHACDKKVDRQLYIDDPSSSLLLLLLL